MILAAAASSSELTIPAIIGIIGGVLGILGVVGAAAAVLRSSYLKATIETLKESNGALLQRNDQLDSAMLGCESRLTALEVENASLRTIVTSAVAVKELNETLLQQHLEAMDMLSLLLVAANKKTPRPRATAPKRAT